MDQTQPITKSCRYLDTGDLERDAAVQTYAVLRRQREKNSLKIRGIGSVIFAIGAPLCIGGIVISIVAYTDLMGTDEVAMFKILGPSLLAISLVMFIVGTVMAEVATKMRQPDNYYHSINRHPPSDRNLLYPDLNSSSSSEYDFPPQKQKGVNTKKEKKRVKKIMFSKKMMKDSFNSLDKMNN